MYMLKIILQGFGYVEQPSWNLKSTGLSENTDKDLMESTAFLLKRFLDAIEEDPDVDEYMNSRV